MAQAPRLGFELGELHCGGQRQVDVVAEQQVAGLRLAVEAGEAVAARLRRLQQLPVVLQVEAAAQSAASTSTSSSVAAASARSSASTFVSPTAIT